MSEFSYSYVSPPSIESRPRPVRDAANEAGRVVGILSALLTSGVGFGLITAVQGDAITGLLGLIPGVVAGGMTVWSAFRTSDRAEHQVTPISDPRIQRDGQLLPLVPDIAP